MSKQRLLIIIFTILLILVTGFLIKPNNKRQTFLSTTKWVHSTSDFLGFSTLIPSTWQVYNFPQKGALFFGSNIYIYHFGKDNKEDFYTISARKIKLEEGESLENIFFPKKDYGNDRDKLLRKEIKNGYLIYTADSLGIQDEMLAVFISKDGKIFLQYVLAPYSKARSSPSQNEIFDRLNMMVDSTRLF